MPTECHLKKVAEESLFGEEEIMTTIASLAWALQTAAVRAYCANGTPPSAGQVKFYSVGFTFLV